METLTAVEDEFVERRIAACIKRNTGGEKKWSMYERARLTRRFDYWTDALECHRSGHDHEGVEGMRKEYAKRMKDAVRSGRPVSESVARSEPYLKAVENRRRYEKGRHTSFANRSAAVDDSMQAIRGYKAKRQDGKPMTPEYLADIDAIVTDFEGVVGALADPFRQTDLTIAHTCGKHPFMSPMGGLWHPTERSISVGVVVGGEPIRAGAHELAHWLDAEAGAALGITAQVWRSSGGGYDTTLLSESRCRGEGDPEGDLLYKAKRSMNRTREVHDAFSSRTKRTVERDRVRASLGPYWRRPCEIFARLVEQWFATTLGRQSAAAHSPDYYESRAGRWTKEDFAELMPDVEMAVSWRLGLLRGKA